MSEGAPIALRIAGWACVAAIAATWTFGIRAFLADRAGAPRDVRKNAVRTLVASGCAIFTPIAIVLGWVLRNARHVDPAEKARVLAEGLSEMANTTAFAVVADAIPLVAALVVALRARRR